MIEAKGLKFRYGIKGFDLSDIDLKAERGYITCLLGKNGSGKTTLLKLLYGMYNPAAGEVCWKGVRVRREGLQKFRQDVAYIGDSAFIPGLKVEENIDFLKNLYPSFDEVYFEKLMKKASLTETIDKNVSVLSKGQKVKLEICFNLARKPEFLIMDEPLANLDPVYKVDILELLQSSVADDRLGILISTHLVDEVSDMVDYVVLLEDGRVKLYGDRFEVLGNSNSGKLRGLLSER